MKKNLFILFSFYFFVLQSVFAGLLRGEPKFYRLALVNCVFISLIAIFGKDSALPTEEKSQGKYENTMKQEGDGKMWHLWIFLISFLFGILVIFWLKDVALYLRIGAGVLGAMIVFLFGGFIFNYKSFRIWEGKLYLILLILVLIWAVIKLSNIDFSVFQIKSEEEINSLTGEIVEDNVVIPEEEIIGNTSITGENLTGINGEFLGGLGETIENIEEDESLSELVTFTDVIKYLLKDSKLSTKTDISFVYIGMSNPDYPYYKTAYEKKMIGKDLHPTKNVMCETYVVMKGLVEEWSVGKYTDIKQAYWDYAKSNGLLPSCEYGEYVKFGDIIN